MRRAILGTLFVPLISTTAAFAQEGFVLQEKPSAQCSIHLCNSINGPSYAEDGSIIRPIGWESWVFIGSPLTPDELNGGKATFREFHSVYIEPSAFEHYRKTGEFPNGTQIVKVRNLLYEGDDCLETNAETGACLAVSGWGYFNGEYSGFELTVKDTTRFDDPGGWVYLNFGEERPWAPTSTPFEASSCNSCHDANAADDFVFTQFYPVLRDNDPKLKRGAAMPAKMEGKMEEEEASIRRMPSVLSPVPVNEEELFAYLQRGEYKAFENQESEAHPSAGPHLDYGHPVKAYFSDALAASMKGDYDEHPKGAAAVKEIFKEDGSGDLVGWAVAVKTEEESDKGNGWFWVEYTSTEDMSQKPVAAGNGVGLCAGCHRGGSDFVLSHLPE